MTFMETTAPANTGHVSRGIQLVCVRCAIPMMLLSMTGLVVAGFLPPLLPSDPTDVIAQIFTVTVPRASAPALRWAEHLDRDPAAIPLTGNRCAAW